MHKPLEIKIHLSNEKLQFVGSSRSNPEVTFDYFPPMGDGQGYTGLEMLLMSLAVCSSTAIVFLLRKMGKEVSGFQVYSKGTRCEKFPWHFEKILLKFTVQSETINENDMLEVLKLSEESHCPVWTMLKGNVEIATEFKIIQPQLAI